LRERERERERELGEWETYYVRKEKVKKQA